MDDHEAESEAAVCPTPEKRIYRSKAKANRYQRRRRPPAGEKKDRLYPYMCPCGEHWHLTHQSPALQARIAARIAAQAAAAQAAARDEEREAS
ncbi:hypothetical protein A5784_30695 [Mycobacterium sp. 852013-50091_SCH5140682]|uniref:hypothetical protein n=1 Tax=Mycobacterium sp. 852013-50091_SCH5140682 TaxID=1834109 RepID=UPI0007EA48BB|nr:hypothetical protein [Mycobacterium sp. 852013-50091_SCH5140682]OBC14073.1 hypothetical protein A5784_30695 [Mycobacterium sp. 852013-50091_SCH5140682]